MQHVSTSFKNELNNDNRRYIKSCDITLADGTKLQIDNSHIWDNGFKVDDAVSNTNSFDIGSAIVGKFILILNNIYDDFSDYDFTGAVISNIKVGIKLPDGTTESVKKGIYIVDEPTYNGSIITLECLDNMVKFDRPYSESNLTYPATLGAIVRDACTCCEVSLAADSASFDKDDFVVQSRPDDQSLTFRQVLVWVGQISCHWCRCNVNGQLSLGWYDQEMFEKAKQTYNGGTFNPWTEGDNLDGGSMSPWTEGETIDGGTFEEMSGHHHIYAISSMSICTDDVVITGIRVVEENPEDSEEEETVYQSGQDGYVLSIEGNKLIQDGKGADVAAYLAGKLAGLQFRPLSVSCLSDPSMEAGDIAFVTDRKGRTYGTLITSTTFISGNYQQVSCDAETPQRNSATRYSQATQVYQELRKKLKRNKSEWEKAMEQLSQRLESSSGLYSTVDTLEDESKIYYLHDKPTLEDSMIVWKMTAEAWGVSTDGGKTWNGGMTVDGEVIARILHTIGLNADWINTGALVVRDSNGNILFNADIDTGRVDIIADSFMLRGKTIEELAQSELNDFVSSVFNDTVTNLQAQIDGQIESFYYDYEPLLTNEPASTWETDIDKTKHEGDLFYWKSKGFAYRFMKDGDSWKWQLVQDTDITKAMEQAAKAQDTADGKRRVFMSTPQPPYDEGDLWATSTEDGKASIKICKSGRAAGSFSSDDWIDPKYVDSTDVDNAITEYDTSLGQTEVFNKLTNNGKNQGIYIENGELLINASYILAGVLAGKFINAKGIKVLDSGNNITFYIDDNGNVTIRASSFTLEGKTVQSIADSAASDALNSAKSYTDNQLNNFSPEVTLTQQEIFNILTNNGQTQGIYLYNGKIYLNAEYIDADAILANMATIGGWKINSDGLLSSNGLMKLKSDGTIANSGGSSTQFLIYNLTNGLQTHKLTVSYDCSLGSMGGSVYINGPTTINDTLGVNYTATFKQPPKLYNLSHVSSGGHVVFASDGATLAYLASSSKRYKKHNRFMSEKDVEGLYNLRPVWFEYKEWYLDKKDPKYGKSVPGFYAEWMHKYFPDACIYDEKGMPEDWNPKELIPAMMKLINSSRGRNRRLMN